MAHPLAPDFRRFLPAWLAFGSSVSFTAFVMMTSSALMSTLEPGETNDAPPLVIVMLAVFIYFAALAVGLFLVPFRRLIIGPRFPFVRRGYLVMAALPLVWLLAPGLGWGQRAMVIGGCELFLVASALVFVGLGRLFGAFDEGE